MSGHTRNQARPDGAFALEAAVLTGGRGTRLRPRLADIPKVLAPVSGRPFLSLLLDQLAHAGIPRVTLLTGYKAPEVEKAALAHWHGLEVAFSREESPLDTGGALRNALPLLHAQAVLVLNGDSYLDADLGDFMAWSARTRPFAALVATHLDDTGRFGRLRLSESDAVSAFEEKSDGSGLVNAGVYLFSREALEAIPAGRPVSLEREVFPSWTDGRLKAFRASGEFLDIGTPESFDAVESFFAAHPPRRRLGHPHPMFAKTGPTPDTRVKLGVGVIVTDASGRILLERRRDCGLWGLPGGRVEPGESVLQAGLREVFEETALTVRIVRLVGVYSEPDRRIVTYLDNGDVAHLVDVVLQAEIRSGDPLASEESLELRFFPPDRLPRDVVPPAWAPLEDYLAGAFGHIR